MLHSIRTLALALAFLVLFSSSVRRCSAADGGEATRQKAVQQGIDYLKSSQNDDGSWTTNRTLGITGLVVNALLESGVPATDPTVQKGLKVLESHVQEDGGIYVPKSRLVNYETCIAVMTLAATNDKKYQPIIEKAEKFLRKLQWDEGEGLETSDVAYGGAGYGGSSRPDLSNTQFLMEALKSAGAKEDDPAFKKAMIFVSRCQNLETEHNTTEFAGKINDGGFYYTPAAGGNSGAGKTPEGGLKSYGTMTYAGLKSKVYAGLKKEDPRVKAAFDWISKFYSLDENPGEGTKGLYYYYHTFAKTLAVL
ncbi:MAG: hypothetical protein KDA84_03270, partial [Planctomycetaceae bacterium]|nr:hypothetical protein [Planctomycetaceae bacterium]